MLVSTGLPLFGLRIRNRRVERLNGFGTYVSSQDSFHILAFYIIPGRRSGAKFILGHHVGTQCSVAADHFLSRYSKPCFGYSGLKAVKCLIDGNILTGGR